MPIAPLISTRTDDRTLCRAAQHGDQSAASELYRRHWGDLLRTCRAITRCEADAADAAQDALVATLGRLGELDCDTLRFGAYAQVAARRAAIDRVRRRDRNLELLDGTHGTPVAAARAAEAPCDAAERRETAHAVRAALRALPDRQRQALFGVAFEERAPEAVGADLDLNANAVNQLVFRARRRMARELDAAA